MTAKTEQVSDYRDKVNLRVIGVQGLYHFICLTHYIMSSREQIMYLLSLSPFFFLKQSLVQCLDYTLYITW